jgi:hypothetical protein
MLSSFIILFNGSFSRWVAGLSHCSIQTGIPITNTNVKVSKTWNSDPLYLDHLVLVEDGQIDGLITFS